MTHRYTHTLSLSIGGDEPTWEGEATVSFAYHPGRPEAAPAYSHGGLPAEDAEVDDVRVTHIDGMPLAEREHGRFEAQTLEDHIESSDDLMSDLLIAATETAFAEHHDAMERRWEDAREAF